MCLILFAYKHHPKYKLILAANRDEFLNRPTAQAAFWEDKPNILAGRDLERKGTWLGLSKTGNFSAITNYREARKYLLTDAPSRGDLTTNFIAGKKQPRAYLEALDADHKVFNGYNLLVGTAHELFHYSNKEGVIHELTAGIYGLSNHLLDTPWPKVELGKKLLQEAIQQDEPDREALLRLLENTQKPPVDQLPNTGVELEWEKVLSSMFIDTPVYGTYCSSLILWDYKNNIEFIEKVHRNPSVQHFKLQVDAD